MLEVPADDRPYGDVLGQAGNAGAQAADAADDEIKPVPAAASTTADREPSADAPVMHVVAEVEDDLPEIEWKLPSIALLDTVTARRERMADEIKNNVKIIERTLETFGVPCKVVGVNPGPAVTQYELQPGPGVQVKRITALQNDLSLALAAAPLRIRGATGSPINPLVVL